MHTLYNVPLCRYLRGPRQFVAELNVSFCNKHNTSHCNIRCGTLLNRLQHYIVITSLHHAPISAMQLIVTYNIKYIR